MGWIFGGQAVYVSPKHLKRDTTKRRCPELVWQIEISAFICLPASAHHAVAIQRTNNNRATHVLPKEVKRSDDLGVGVSATPSDFHGT